MYTEGSLLQVEKKGASDISLSLLLFMVCAVLSFL
jgi:hypothetical protein